METPSPDQDVRSPCSLRASQSMLQHAQASRELRCSYETSTMAAQVAKRTIVDLPIHLPLGTVTVFSEFAFTQFKTKQNKTQHCQNAGQSHELDLLGPHGGLKFPSSACAPGCCCSAIVLPSVFLLLDSVCEPRDANALSRGSIHRKQLRMERWSIEKASRLSILPITSIPAQICRCGVSGCLSSGAVFLKQTHGLVVLSRVSMKHGGTIV